MPYTYPVFNAYSGITYLQALQDIRGRELTIASAFAVSRQQIDLLRRLALQNRKVTFIVGTQGGFTSPDFIDAGRKLARELSVLEFIVDFRMDASLHQKWALASPCTVIIGSSNFTQKGLAGECDLMAEVTDKALYCSLQDELSRIRRLCGVFAADAAEFVAAQKRYKTAAEQLSDIELKRGVVKSKANPYAAPDKLPSLAEWLDSDVAASLRIFGYTRDLDEKEKEAESKVRKDAEKQRIALKGADAYSPHRLFDGPFLDVNGINSVRRTIHPAEVVISSEVDGIRVVLARRVPWKNFGFKMTPAEAKLIAALAAKKSEGRLSVADMRKALST